MKRLVPIYLFVLAATNGIMGWSGGWLAQHLRTAYSALLHDDDLPLITVRALHLPSAFYVAALLGLGLALLTWSQRVSGKRWAHAGVGIVAFDIALLSYLLLGFVMPFFTLTIKI